MATDLATQVGKVSVRERTVHGRRRYMVRWLEFGRVKRKFFGDRKRADGFAKARRGDALAVDEKILLLPVAVREKLYAAHALAAEKNLDLLALALAAVGQKPVSPTLAAVLAEMLAVKKAAGRAARYLTHLRSVCGQFAAGREEFPIADVSLGMIEVFLNSKNSDYRGTCRARLAAWFSFAVRRKYIAHNFCDDLESVAVVRKLPVIFSPAQAKVCVDFLRGEEHRATAWFLLTTFAALRPEEGQQLSREELRASLAAEVPHVEVTPNICKTGQWRMVYPRPEVVTALRWALEHGSELPLSRQVKKRTQKKLRDLLKLEKWPRDVTRHSGASYWLALTNDLKFMVEQLGNSERIFKGHYKKPLSRAAAEEFFGVLEIFQAATAKNPP